MLALQVYAILDEVFLAGEIEETSKQVVLTRLEHLDKLEWFLSSKPLQTIKKTNNHARPGRESRSIGKEWIHRSAQEPSNYAIMKIHKPIEHIY